MKLSIIYYSCLRYYDVLKDYLYGALTMKTIAICLNPFISHVNPIFELAKRMKQSGLYLIFIGARELESLVEKRGFEYIPITNYDDSVLQRLKRQKKYIELENAYRRIHTEVQEALMSRKPDMVLIGVSRFQVYLLPARLAKVKTLFYSLNIGATQATCCVPPTTCGYIGGGKEVDKLACLYFWGRRFIRKVTDKSFFVQFKRYPLKQLRYLSKVEGWGWKFGIDGVFPDFPIIVLGSNFLEFAPLNASPHAGLCVENIEERALDIRITDLATKTLIYCSLGSMASRYENGPPFINAVIEVFRQNPQWHLLISLGGINREELLLENLPLNVTVYDFAPQREILQYASLVITHGGHGTIKECIAAGVPMIVFPCSYDQHGNAARVTFHEIGIRSTILKKTLAQRFFHAKTRDISMQDIIIPIKEVLSNSKYKKNIIRLRDKISEADEAENIVRYIQKSI